MSRIEFRKDDEEQNRRIFLESRPRHVTKLLVPLIEQLTEAGVIIEPRKTSRIHMTWLQLGRPERLQAKIIRVNPDLDPDNLAEDFEDLLLDIKSMRLGSIAAFSERLSFYSYPPRSFLALKMQKTAELVEGRDLIMERFIKFLHSCGISDVEAFMRSTADLKFQVDDKYNPHITLGVWDPQVTLPDIDVSNIQLLLRPPRLANVRVVR